VIIGREKTSPIGLDIGSSSLKLIQFGGKGHDPVVIAAAHCDLPAPTGDPQEAQSLLKDIIVQTLRTRNFVGKEVITALGPAEFQMKNIRLPKMPAEEMASAVEYEAEDRLKLEGPAQIRHVRAGEVRHGNELKEEVILFAVQDDVVAARLALLESLKLSPVGVEISPLAMARSFLRFLRRAEDVDAVNVFVEVGHATTSIVIMHGTDICFLKTLEIGGRDLSEAVSKALNLSMQQAMDLRVRMMRESGSRRRDDHVTVPEEVHHAVNDAIRPTLARISRDVQLCLRYYAVTFRGERVDGVTLVGGEAHEAMLKTVLSETIDLPCYVGNPLRGLAGPGLEGLSNLRMLSPAWAVACGLALRGSDWIGRPVAAAAKPGRRTLAAAS
jgi:type IV pilus assembly protein PilM